MGEAVVRGKEGMEMVVLQEEADAGRIEKAKETCLTEVGRERILPPIVLRVLLVEADDSTRQIIAALLRKCSYRVAAVADGLKAWETLKGRPHDIDLILTEVELPLISGFALLSLVTEHEICKKIPVIMMSSQDSVSVVLKCMLKGAADFLIKPVRRNELRNIWQHVWRRHTPTGGHHACQKLTAAQDGVDATSENDATSNHLSDCVLYKQSSKQCSEKGSEVKGISLRTCRSTSNLSNIEIEKHGEGSNLDEESIMLRSETKGKSIRLRPEAVPWNEAHNLIAVRVKEDHACAGTMIQNELMGQDTDGEITAETHGCNNQPVEPSREAIDFIGRFENRSKFSPEHTNSDDGANNFGWALQLGPTLRNYYPNGSKDQGIDERQTLNRSDVPSFSWYNSKTLEPLFPTLAGNCADLHEDVSKSDILSSNQFSENTVASSQWYRATSSNSQENMNSFPMSSLIHSNPEIPNLEQGYCSFDDATNNYAEKTMHKEKIIVFTEKVKHGSDAAPQSGSSSLCNSVGGHHNSSLCGSICNGSDGSAILGTENGRITAPETSGDEVINHDEIKEMGFHRSSQREAALAKFRLKRKDRCYEKKVRYQSRKRLADQRPRVKGQFVRQVETQLPTC
ncbi:two-component response regulator-like APRR5 [Malania oleifera]|uniref:two-component response regulator-like APRR5 n=1 Tax=Malania oleifera TaxID=397392 RepID=UPI0025AE461E|nr:two-component response regulator-like APRR5 [Malania oleifera]